MTLRTIPPPEERGTWLDGLGKFKGRVSRVVKDRASKHALDGGCIKDGGLCLDRVRGAVEVGDDEDGLWREDEGRDVGGNDGGSKHGVGCKQGVAEGERRNGSWGDHVSRGTFGRREWDLKVIG